MKKPAHWVRYTARTIALLWAAWWTFFGLASGIGENLNLPGILIHTIVPGLIFGLSAVIAWRWERVGSLLLIGMGIVSMAYYPFATTVPGFLTLSLPPMLAGLLFLFQPGRRITQT